MQTDKQLLIHHLAKCGWSSADYLQMNPDLAELAPDNLPDHFLTHGLREKRPHSQGPHVRFHLEKVACSGRHFIMYGWGEQESDDTGVLLVREGGSSIEWEFIETGTLWFWRDDVANHLRIAPKTHRHGVVLAGSALDLDLKGCRIYVHARGRFTEFTGVMEARATASHCQMECFQMLENLLVHNELLYLLSKYPSFLAQVGQVHESEMMKVPVTQVYAKPNTSARYAICAVVLGNPEMLKAWLMSLPDHHNLSACEVNLLCNGLDGYDAILQTARWFGDVLGGHIRLLFSPENLGFNIAVNHLVQAAAAGYVMITNIDVQYLRFDLDRLIETCEHGNVICAARQFNGMGAVQHLSLEIKIRADMVHSESFPALESKLIGRNTYLANNAKSEEEVEFFGAACFFGKRKLLAALGPFSPKYLYAYHEDSEMALRARRHGVRLLVTDALDLIHFESSGARVDLPKRFFIAANSARLLASILQNQSTASVIFSETARPDQKSARRGIAVKQGDIWVGQESGA